MSSPRTDQRPMAFTAWEFIRGALLTYVYFLPLTLIPFVAMFAGSLLRPEAIGGYLDPQVSLGMLSLWVFMLVPSVTWGLAALIPAALVALAIGLGLRGQARRGVHLLVHGLWGLIVGVGVSSLVLGVWPLGSDPLGLVPTVLGFGLAVALAATLAWWTTAGLALRRDARQVRA